MKYEELQYERLGDANKTYPASTLVIRKQYVDEAIAELKSENENIKDAFGGTTIAYNQVCDEYEQCDKELRATKCALWMARAASAKFWANYWFDIAPSKYIKYDRIGRREGVEKEFILTKVTKHMTASDWVGLWEKVERLCRNKVEEYK